MRLAHPDGSEVIWTINKVSLAQLLEHNLLSTIPLSKKWVEAFLYQFQMSLEISKPGLVFGVADIVDDQYIIRTIDFSPNNISEPSIVNSMILISIQTGHRRMSHLGYQNFLRLSKIADGIEVNVPIPAEICQNCMESRQQRKLSNEPMSTSSEYLDDLHWDLGELYPITQKCNQF